MKYLTISGLSRFLNNLKKLIPSKMSQLTNDSGYITADQVPDITGYSKTEVDYLFNQADSNAVHLTGNETIEGAKTFTSFPTLYYGTGDNYLSFLKSASLTFGTAPQNTQTYSIRCLDKNDIIISEFSSQAQANGINNLSLRVRNTDGTNIYDRRINFNINTSGLTYFAPNIDNICSLGVADHQWKSVYANSYYLGSTAFGDIVTHNASEFLTSHQDLSLYPYKVTSFSNFGNGRWSYIDLGNTATHPNGFNEIVATGKYHVRWTNATTVGVPFTTSAEMDGILEIEGISSASGVSSYQRIVQRFYRQSSPYKVYFRYSVYHDGTWNWSDWTSYGDIVTHNASEFLTSHQSLSNYVTLDGAQTISGEKIFTTFPVVKSTHANNGIIYIKSPTTFGTAPSTTTYTYALRCVDNADTILADFIAQQSTSGSNSIQLRVRNTDGTLVYDRRVQLSVATDGTTFLIPNADDVFYLGYSNLKWKAVYSNAYYLGSTAFGDIVTHNSSEYAASSHAHTKSQITDFPTLATVATSGSYTDLSDKPTIPTVNNATLTIQKNGTTVKTFTANASSNVTCNITVPTKTSEITNDSGFLTSHQSLSNYSTLANTVKSLSISGKTITVTPGSGNAYTLTTQDTTYSNFVKSGSGAKAGLVPAPSTTAGTTKYLREDGTWQVPPDHTYTVNNATLTIQKNGSNVATFTSNASSNVTANITVPTKTSELTNDSGFLTSHQSLSNYLTKTTNVSEMGRYIDMHYDNATAAYDYDARLYVTSQGTAKGGGALAIAAASVTAPNLTVTNNSANGIKFGSYTLYVG